MKPDVVLGENRRAEHTHLMTNTPNATPEATEPSMSDILFAGGQLIMQLLDHPAGLSAPELDRVKAWADSQPELYDGPSATDPREFVTWFAFWLCQMGDDWPEGE